MTARAQITPVIAPFQGAPYAASPGYVRFGAPIQFSARVLPADATGTIAFSVNGGPAQAVPLTQQTLGDYIAVGDSITAAEYIADPAQRYQSLAGLSLNLQVQTFASPGYTSCEAMLYNVFPNGVGLATAAHPLYSLLIGTNDLSQYGVGPGEALFDLCHQAAISWLGVARPSKTLVGDPGLVIRSGAWSAGCPFASCSAQILTNAAGSGTARFTLTTYGGAAFLWYVAQVNSSGSFAVSVDGGSFGAPTSTLWPTTADGIPGAYAVLRLPVAAGVHTFDVASLSGPVSILGMGAAPSAGAAGIVPAVLVGDVPNQWNGDTAGIAEYTSDIQSNIALLQGDGLDIRFVPTQRYMFATAAEMVDMKHPNALGLSELAAAFAAAVTSAHPAADTIAAATASFSVSSLPIGNHSIAMSYSGDKNYAPVAANTIGVGVYDGSSTSTLTSDAAIYSVQSPIVLAAAISSNDLGEVDFVETTPAGSTILASAWLNQPGADPVTVTLPSLPLGQHTLRIDYLGDYRYNGSASPALQIDVSGHYTTTSLSSSGTHYSARAPVVLNAAVNPAGAGGSIAFLDGVTPLGQLASSTGLASFTTSALAPGIHALTARFGGDSTQDASQSPVLSIEIDPDPTSLGLAASTASQPYGGSVTFLATLAPTAASGSVVFNDLFMPVGSSQAVAQSLGNPALLAGAASLNAASLAPGTHSVTAVYTGDTDDLAASSQPVAVQIALDASTTALAPIPATFMYGTALQLAAAVSPAASTGSVTFLDSAAGTLAQAAVANGSAGFSTTTLAPGTHALSAAYSGDSFRGPSASLALTTTISRLTSTIALATPATTLYAGDPLALSATVSPAAATGTVIFRDAALGVLGGAPVSLGSATLSLPNPAVAAYAITATYSGDTFDAPSTSATVATQVKLNPTAVALTASAATAAVAAPLTLNASVSPSSATGTINFLDAAVPLATVLVANGTASAQVSSLAAGTHILRAVFSGNPIDETSTSAPLTETISADATETTLNLAQASIVAGSTAAVNARVATASTVPTGIITLRAGMNVLASGPLASASVGVGYATLTFNSATLGLGSFALIASYSGDSGDQPSDSSASTETVLPIPTALALTLSAASVRVQTSVTLTATVNAASSPAGSVTFLSNGSAIATSALAAGSASTIFAPHAVGAYVLTATYAPSGLFAPAPAASPQTLTAVPPVSLILTPAAVTGARGSTQSATLVLTPNFGFTGAIQTQCQTSASWIVCTIAAPAAIAGPVNAPVQISIAQTTAAMTPRNPAWLVLALLAPLLIPRRKRGPPIVALLFLATAMTACGGVPFPAATGPQSATITVTAAGTPAVATLTVNIAE